MHHKGVKWLDPVRWSPQVGWSVIAGAAFAAFISFQFVDSPWMFRVAFFGGFVVGAATLLRGGGVHWREVAILVVTSLAALVFFRYFTDRPISVVGQGISFGIPWLMGAGFGHKFVLGTIAPGRYSGFAPGDEKIADAFRRSWEEIGRALKASNEKSFREHLQRAVALGSVETAGGDWIAVRQHFLAYAQYLGGADLASENTELQRLGDAAVDRLRDVLQGREVRVGRWGRPNSGPASAN
jgi:hypothetical protein